MVIWVSICKGDSTWKPRLAVTLLQEDMIFTRRVQNQNRTQTVAYYQVLRCLLSKH